MPAKRLLTIASLLLASSGLAALVLNPASAGADELDPATAEFTVAPGDSTAKSFRQLMIGSAELRPDAESCRHDPVTGLSCAVHRIRIAKRTPGFYLRVSTYWMSQEAPGVTSVPEVDTYLYASKEEAFDDDKVGGVSAAMPETIRIIEPAQDEFDLVVGAWAGAITAHRVVVEYTDAPTGPSPAAADIVLNVGKAFKQRVNSILGGYTGEPVIQPFFFWEPDDCRNDPSRDVVCDVYRLKLNRSRAADASNFVVVELTWPAIYTPPVALNSIYNLEPVQQPNLDIVIWDTSSHYMGRSVAGGQSAATPERAAFTATQDEYDVVIQASDGVATGYTLRAKLLDEHDGAAPELLDASMDAAPTVPSGKNSLIAGGGRTGPTAPRGAAPLPRAAVLPDGQIAGIGLGATEQFEMPLSRSGTRHISAPTAPPPGVVLWLALIVGPFGVATLCAGIMRRRHTQVF